MCTFDNKLAEFFAEFGQGRRMVLSSSENNVVSSRMMSVVRIGGCFYFQTDKLLRKYRQLIANPSVALCIDNIQIEGICEETGRPKDDADFCGAFQACFIGSYNAYSLLQNERLFKVTPARIERWLYLDGEPFIEEFDFDKRLYSLQKYVGI